MSQIKFSRLPKDAKYEDQFVLFDVVLWQREQQAVLRFCVLYEVQPAARRRDMIKFPSIRYACFHGPVCSESSEQCCAVANAKSSRLQKLAKLTLLHLSSFAQQRERQIVRCLFVPDEVQLTACNRAQHKRLELVVESNLLATLRQQEQWPVRCLRVLYEVQPTAGNLAHYANQACLHVAA